MFKVKGFSKTNSPFRWVHHIDSVLIDYTVLEWSSFMTFEKSIKTMKMPENLLLGMMVQKHRAQMKSCPEKHDYYAFVLGQSPFHTPYEMQKALSNSAHQNFYAPAKGIDTLVQEIIRFNKEHFDLDLKPNRVVIGNGTKMIMFMLLSMLKGHYILPSPAWIGYVPLLDYLNKSYALIRLKPENHYKLSASDLDQAMAQTNQTPIFILNNPHNPTGALYQASELKALAAVCRKHQAVVISDEIYALTTYEQKDFLSMAKIYPENTFVTNGISKDRSAAGYRLGTCILPSENTAMIQEKYAAFASTLYTNVSTPIQHAAITAYSDNKAIKNYMNITRQIHAMVGTYFSDYCQSIEGINASKPEGGFYFTIDFNALKKDLTRKNITTASDLTQALLAKPYYIALVMGESIAASENDLIARIAFIDYQGEAVYHAFMKENPKTKTAQAQFIQTHMHHMVKGFAMIKQFVHDLAL